MKKYIVLNGKNKNGIACFNERQKKLTVNLEDFENLRKREYLAIYVNDSCIGKTVSGRGCFKLENMEGGIKVMKEKFGTDESELLYVSDEVGKENIEKPKENTEDSVEQNFKWRKVRGYYCIKNIEILKYVMNGENIYAAINKKGYYLFGENKNNFAVAVPVFGDDVPFAENVKKFAKRIHIAGGEYYTVMMGTDEDGEYFLKPVEK